MTHLLLRIGVAFAFIYPPLSALIDPYAWVGYLPSFLLDTAIDPMLILHIFGLFELCIGVLLLLNIQVKKIAAVSACVLFVIVAYHYKQMDVLFRDVPILLMAVALILSDTKDQ